MSAAEPVGYLRIKRGSVEFIQHEGELELKRCREEIGCDVLAMPWAMNLAESFGLALVIDDSGRLVDRPLVTALVKSPMTDDVVGDLCGTVLVAGRTPEVELHGARISVLMQALGRFLVVTPSGVEIPAMDARMAVISFDDHEAFARYLGCQR